MDRVFLLLDCHATDSTMISAQRTNRLRQNLQSQIKRDFPNTNVCLLLSGGADSTLLGLVAHSVGKDVHAISFERKGVPNWDCDQAEATSAKMGWQFTKVVIPTENPKSIFVKLITEHGCKKKTELEVLYPFLFLMDAVVGKDFDAVLTGFGNPLPDSRTASVRCRNDPLEYWDHVVSTDTMFDASKKCIEAGASKGVEVLTPLYDKKFKKLMHGMTMTDMHKLYWKSVWKNLYPTEFENLGLLKEGRTPNLQKGGSIPEFFAPLLDDPEINYRGYNTGTTTNRISHLVKLWAAKPRQITNGVIPDKKVTFKPYLLEDVKKQSKKELFSVVTTFAGGGGSSTGYRLAGGKILLANEFVPTAIETYHANYPDTPVDGSDIRKITRKNGQQGVLDWFKSYGIKHGSYDILDGSPPCSTFSTSGVGEGKNETRDVKYSDVTQDRIGYLIHEFVYLANCTQPKICILENVPNIAKSDVFTNALSRLRRYGYKVNHKVLTASYYGVPQRRKRMFVVGIRPDVADKIGLQDEADILSLYPQGSSYQPSVKDAIADVEVDKRERNLIISEIRKGTQYEVIRGIRKDPEHPARLLDTHIKFKNLYFNTYRCAWNAPAPTITQLGNQLGGRGGIFHPTEDRTFTIKELLRLTALPDDFKLTGTFNQRAERIGRCVPPLMTAALAASLYEKVLKPTQSK